MQSQRLDELLKNYRANKAREAYLRHQLETLERFLKIASAQMVNDSVSLSQALTGMPHGSGNGDPTGRLAVGLAAGDVTDFVKQIRREIAQTQTALDKIMPDIHIVEIVLAALTEREREVMELYVLDELNWASTLEKMNQKHGGSYAKRSLQRLLDRAMEKAYAVVA